MPLSKRNQILLGVFTLVEMGLPFVFVMGMMAIFSLITPNLNQSNFQPDPQQIVVFLLAFYGSMFCFVGLYGVLSIALRVIYVWSVVKMPQMGTSLQVILILGIFYFPIIALPIHFFLHIWGKEGEAGGVTAESVGELAAG
ncbi:MAG TPA: hypothetical protein PK299_01890 [Anaerolineales bacterium]|nr:hypothetical protein [Anaerolineales bacterium]